MIYYSSSMKNATVFGWAQVQLAEECLRILPEANAPKQRVVNELASAGGVTVIWERNGLVKLEGTWIHILKSQAIFENYLKSLEDPEASGNSDLNCEHRCVTSDGESKEDSSPKCSAPVNNPESNEMYVNITLSGTDISDFSHDSVPMINNVHDNMTESCDKSSENKNESSQIFNCEGNTLEHNFIIQTENNSLRENTDTDMKTKENRYNTSEYQHSVLYSICTSQPADIDLKKSHGTEETIRSSTSSFGQDVNNDVSRTFHPVEKELSSENVPLLDSPSTENHNRINSLDIKDEFVNKSAKSVVEDSNITFSSNQIKQKYHKKKDYEELAPFKFFCSLCSFKSKRESHFARHMKLHNEVSKLFKCSQCTFTSIRLSHLRRHELNHSKLTLACNICQYRTNSQKLLLRHNRFKHSAPEVPEVKKDVLQCDHCEYKTSRSCFLQRHMKVHIIDASLIQMYQCKQCSYKTNRKEHFMRHTSNIHEGRRPFLCHWCGKAFKRQDALKQHSSTHTAQDAVTCPECGKGCRSQSHLSQHMSVHSSDRLFLCELCGASFKTRAVQRKHMFTIHQHPKAFLCSHCSRKFSTKFALRRHVKQHSSQLPAEKSHQEQVSASTFITDTNTSMKLVAMDTVFLSESLGSNPHRTNISTGTAKERAKLTLQTATAFQADSVHVIPAQTVMHTNSETTALVYLTRTFVPLQR